MSIDNSKSNKMSLEKKVTKIRNLFPKSSPIHFRFETGQTSFLNCNLCWMGGHLSIHAVVYPSNIFYELKTGQSNMFMITLFIWNMDLPSSQHKNHLTNNENY